MKSELSGTVLEALRRYDTPTVCNAVELFGVRPRNSGYMDSRIQACFPDLPPMVGFASTATFRSAAPPAEGDIYASLEEQVANFSRLPGPAVVVFQDLDDPPAGATFGEVMCSTYKAFGASGLITSGAARDLDQVRRLDFPVFSNGSICSHGYAQIVSLEVPVRTGGLTVYPGDLIHADRNGAAVIPPDIAPEVPEACSVFMEAEAMIFEYLRTGSVTVEGFREAQKACNDRIARLKKEIGRKGP